MTNRLTTLIETFEQTRGLSRYYLSLLKEYDPYQEFELGGVKLNSIHWIVCHLCWSENFLLIETSGGPSAAKELYAKYAFGTTAPSKEEGPSMAEAMADLKSIHEKCMTYLATLSEADLDKENVLNLAFGSEKSVKMMIMHAIRHEGTHAGHLGWLCKLNAIKTF